MLLRWHRLTWAALLVVACSCMSPAAALRQLRQVGIAAASCYTLQITATHAGFDSLKHQLTPEEPSSVAVYASLHRCFHGILFPDTPQVANVTYEVDPPDPVYSVVERHVTPAKIRFSKIGLRPGLHTLQATVAFKDPAWIPLVLTGDFRVADSPAPPPPK